MKSIFVAAVAAAAIAAALPAAASAQESEAVPRPAVATPQQQDPQTPPPPPPPREGAVRRQEARAPEQPRSEPRAQESRVPDTGGGAVERPPARESRPAPERPRREPAEAAATGGARREPAHAAAAPAAEADGQNRRGAVRRPSGAQTPNDRAVPRTSPPPPRDRQPSGRYYPSYPYYRYDPYYSRYYYDPWGYGAFGLGYFYYSPWSWGPSYGYYPQYAGPHGYDIGAVRLKVNPRDAEVWVDGYYAGVVDDFDGIFQSLKLDLGAYRIEIRKPGFAPLQFDVRVQPDRTITFRGELKPAP